MHTNRKESGLVSILAVIMFMIFVSIIVVGFIKIMSDEQSQTTDNDLSASALTAAQGGVEDAKRVIALCLEGDPLYGDKNNGQCRNIFESSQTPNPCSVFKGGAKGLFMSMGIQYDLATDEAQVGAPEFNQYYTCLTIDANPDDVAKTLVAGKSEIIPLATLGDPVSVDINWKGTSGAYSNRPASLGSDFPAYSQWTGLPVATRPPVVRVQVIPYTPSNIQLATLESAADTFFLVPATGALATPAFDRTTSDMRGAPGSVRGGSIPIQYSPCITSSSGYDCNKRITNFPNTQEYYLRLTLLYGADTTITVTPRDAANNPTPFDDVQYIVDVTGRANDVYRRLQARVSPAVSAALPEYALESAGPICKDIIVSTLASTQYCP